MILNNVEVKILASMKLIDAYNSLFPKDFIMENVIYCIHNEVNGKNYVGQTVKVENRFSKTYVGHFRDYERYISGELKKTRVLYKAWKKYGLESFSVFIIDTGIDREELNQKEMYWIKALHTCTKDPECFGYNLSWGADDMGVKDPDSIRRSLETRKRIYGDYFPNCHTQEAYDKGNRTKTKKYGHGGWVNVFTPKANEKRKQTNIEKFGSEKGILVQIWENNMKIYGNKLGPANLSENRKKGNFNRRLNLCLKRINKIISSSDEVVTTWNQYKNLIPLNFSKIDSITHHLNNLKELLPYLKLNNKWTPVLDSIFQDLINMPEEDFDNLMKEMHKSKWKTAEEKLVKFKKGNITRMFKSINRVLSKNTGSKPLNWKEYCDLVFSSVYNSLHDAYKHLDKLIDLLPSMKQDPRWTKEYESIFGSLTEKDKVKRKRNRRK